MGFFFFEPKKIPQVEKKDLLGKTRNGDYGLSYETNKMLTCISRKTNRNIQI